MPGAIDETSLRRVGTAAGLDAVGIAPAEPFAGTLADLVGRKAQGLHGGMQFTYRRPERSTDPSATVAGATALVVGARSYRAEAPERPVGAPSARVARYAWTDHYAALRAGLGAVADQLRAAGHRAVVVADENNLVDREAAHRAGLGWYGKNANLLLPGEGSWFVLGSVVTDAPLDPSAAPVADGCGTCVRCIDGCPTGAIVAPGVVDARRCLAWLVQAPGALPREFRVALHDRLYGCDDCQEVCPPNRRAGRSTAGGAAGAAGAADAPGPTAWVPVLDLLAADDATLLDRHGRWYIADREPRFLRRNAVVVLGNIGDPTSPEVAAAVSRLLAGPDPMLRAHAAWAARRLGRDDLLTVLAGETDPEVRAELAAPAPPRRAA